MPTTLTNGIQLPDKGSVDWYSSMESNYNLIDTHLGDTDVHVTAEDKANWDSKQGSLSQDQLDAIAQVAINTDDIATLQSNKADASHTHSSTDITDIDDYATKDYVDNSISGLVDNAPDALNTLNELSAALNDDSNFASTVTTALATKANSADLATVATTGDYDDLSNKPSIPTNTSDLTNDSGFITSSDVPTSTSDLINDSNFVDTSNSAVSSGITSTKVTDYDTHIADTDIHVTTTDKNKWNNQTYVFRYSSTALTPSSTNSNALLDNTDNLKVGDKVIDSSGVLFSITAIDTANSTFTIGTALIDLATDSDVVHKSGNETIAGIKSFSNSTYITSLNFTNEVESQSSSNSAVLPLIATVTYTDQSTPQTARLNFRITANGDKSLYPHENNQYSLGVTSRRWTTLYGYFASLGGTYLGNEISANERTNLYLLANRDTDGQSGAYIGRFRQNRAQGAMSDGDVSFVSFDFLENSTRYTRCFTMGLTDWDSNGVPQTYYITAPNGKGVLGTSYQQWNKVYANEYYYGSANTEFSTKFVTTDTAQTISGTKTFDSDLSISNTDTTANTPNLNLRNYKADRGTTDTAVQTISFLDKNAKALTLIESRRISNGNTGTNILCYNTDDSNNTVSGGVSIIKGKTDTNFAPNADNAVTCGRPLAKWSGVYSNEYYYGANNTPFTNKFVTTDTAQTIGGVKTFSDIPVFSSFNGIRFRCAHNSSAYITFRNATQVNPGSIILSAHDGSVGTTIHIVDKTLIPYNTADIDLGTASKKWKSFNGVEPSSLGMPDLANGIDISSYITTGNTDNNYTPPANGWIWIRLIGNGASIKQGNFGINANYVTNNPTNEKWVETNLFVTKDVQATISCRSITGIVIAKFYPCLGNV